MTSKGWSKEVSKGWSRVKGEVTNNQWGEARSVKDKVTSNEWG